MPAAALPSARLAPRITPAVNQMNVFHAKPQLHCPAKTVAPTARTEPPLGCLIVNENSCLTSNPAYASLLIMKTTFIQFLAKHKATLFYPTILTVLFGLAHLLKIVPVHIPLAGTLTNLLIIIALAYGLYVDWTHE